MFLFVNVRVFLESCFTMADKTAPSQTLHLSSILIASAEDQELSCLPLVLVARLPLRQGDASRGWECVQVGGAAFSPAAIRRTL